MQRTPMRAAADAERYPDKEVPMPHLKSRSLFISHSWSYSDAYEKLVALLDAAPSFQYKNYSVPKDHPVHNAPNLDALYKAIRNQMVFCDVVLIMAGKYATYSKWIQREIQIAKKDFSKPIVAIRPWANEQVSSVVSDAADRLVGWNTNSIVSAIRELDP
jgi:hypothetical protein